MNLVMREIADSVPLAEATMHLTDLATPPNRLLASRSTCRANLLVGTAMTDADGRLAVDLDRALTNGLPVLDHECVVDVGRHHLDRSEPLEQDARIEQTMNIEAIRLAALKLLERAGLHVQVPR